MIARERPFTYADLQDMPDDGMRREIINGELVVSPAPTPGHQRVLRSIFRLIDSYALANDAGEVFFAPVDVLFSRFNVVEPDLVFLSNTKPRIPSDQQAIDVPPDLVVEVISPSTRGTDRVRKLALYAGAGVREYWIADPRDRALTILSLTGDDYVEISLDSDGLLSSRVLDGLKFDPNELFRSLD